MEKENIEEKIESLLSSMSLDEKVAQLKARSVSIPKVIGKLLLEDFFSELRPELKEKIIGFIFNFYSNRELAEEMTKTLWRKMWKEVVLEGVEEKYPIGELSCALRSMSPRESAQFANEIQKYVLENSRVKIPILIHDEALHGCMAKGSTIFPQAIGMASTWNPELIYQVATAIGKETRSRGIHQVLSPTINIARDPRCGRTEETYGEDPYLASRMAVAYIKGVQEQGVIATPKHFAANFVGDGGRDSYPIHFSERLLREIYFPAFRASIEEAGALSLMAAYNSLDGVPCSSNKWLLTRVLREEWGFKGYVVSDYFSVLHLMTKHKVAESKAEAAKLSLEAGLDMELPDSDCFEEIPGLIREGKLSQDTLDEAVRRVLRVKFWAGLFDKPFVDPDYAERINDCSEHRELALRVAQESIVLLKNKGILPLSKDIRSVAVIGPNVAVPRLGGYSGYGVKVVTPLEGIKNKLRDKVEIYFAEGCGLNDTSKSGFDEAIKIAQKSDVAILFMGNSVPETEGEQRDRHNLNLPGVQEELIKEICNTNTPVIVVLINGSAVTMMNWIDKVQAVIEAWYPGEEGGTAIADVLFGDYNPGGKLPISFPKYSSQLPLYYNHKPSGRVDDYVDLRGNQYLFPFGHGLSYTDFKYSNLRITPEEIPRDGEVVITFDIENIGKYKGDEVVQLYLHDEFASLARPIKELKRFERITLDVGERKTVSFKLNRKDLEFLNMDMELVVEPGRFEVLIGSSSEDIRLKGFFIVK